MLRKILFGALWFVVFLVVGLLAAVAIEASSVAAHAVGEMQAYDIGYAAGVAAARLTPYIIGGAALLAIIGAATGVLPGTRTRRGTTRLR